MAVDARLATAGVGRLGGLVAERALVALVALAAVGEGIEGQAQPVHAPAGTQRRQASAGMAQPGTSTHSPPALSTAWLSTGTAPAPAQYCTGTGMALPRHGTGMAQPSWHGTATALAWLWHGTTSTGQPRHDSVLVAWHGVALPQHGTTSMAQLQVRLADSPWEEWAGQAVWRDSQWRGQG